MLGDTPHLAAILLAGQISTMPHIAVDDVQIVQAVAWAHRIEELDDRYRDWAMAERRFDQRNEPCMDCGEPRSECDCIPF